MSAAGALPICSLRDLMACAIALMLATATTADAARQSPPDLCRDAARSASVETGVPYDVLMAVALTETGRLRNGALEPWPWAIQYDGQGRWFDTKAEAVAMAEATLETGATNIDLGCFQLNIRWHAGAFSSAGDMISPDRNARYAADFLAKLYRESGDWTVAAGAYHSRNPDTAEAYREKFAAILADLQDGAPLPDRALADASPSRGDNRFQLLQAGSPGGIGSLVPRFVASTPLIGG